MTPDAPDPSGSEVAAHGDRRTSGVRLSVITATVGRRELMLRKLESLEAQTLPADRFEWIVCDNGSQDATIEELERRTPVFPLRFVRFSDNRGPARGRNACVEQASGEILYLSDDDCLLAPDALERHLEAQERPCVAVGAIDFQAPGGRQHRWRPRRAGFWNVNGANTSLPAADFREAGGFDETLSGYGGEDVLLGYRLGASGLPIRALPEAEVVHVGPDVMTGGDVVKARSAGANAARIAARYPALAWRLGVHPVLLTAKSLTLPLLAPLAGPRGRAELAYARGAVEARRAATPAYDSEGRRRSS